MLNELLVRVWTWFHREEGQDLIEYAMIVAALSIAIVAAIVLGGIPGAFTTWATNVKNEILGA
jgi:Flp pilus assembly pilin Flp